jgi:hypothetical protein
VQLANAGDVLPEPPREAAAKTPAGVPVTVNAEMRGAGIVSSGATLPPIPPVTGDRKNPVP